MGYYFLDMLHTENAHFLQYHQTKFLFCISVFCILYFFNSGGNPADWQDHADPADELPDGLHAAVHLDQRRTGPRLQSSTRRPARQYAQV